MKKILTAFAISVALPAASFAQAPAATPPPQTQACADHPKMDNSKTAGMDHSKTANMDHSKMAGTNHSKNMMGSCATQTKAGSTSDHQGHSGH